SPPNRHPIRPIIIAEIIVVDAEEESSVFVRLARRRVARSDEDVVRIAAVAVANLTDQRADPGVINRIVRTADVGVAVAVGGAAGGVPDLYCPFLRRRMCRCRVYFHSRFSSG